MHLQGRRTHRGRLPSERLLAGTAAMLLPLLGSSVPAAQALPARAVMLLHAAGLPRHMPGHRGLLLLPGGQLVRCAEAAQPLQALGLAGKGPRAAQLPCLLSDHLIQRPICLAVLEPLGADLLPGR